MVHGELGVRGLTLESSLPGRRQIQAAPRTPAHAGIDQIPGFPVGHTGAGRVHRGGRVQSAQRDGSCQSRQAQ